MSDFIIYGYCPAGEAVLHECIKRKWNVICYCDDSDVRRDHSEASVPILSLKEIREQKKKGTFIIAVANCGQIIKKLNPDEEYILACEILDNPDEDLLFVTKNLPWPDGTLPPARLSRALSYTLKNCS